VVMVHVSVLAHRCRFVNVKVVVGAVVMVLLVAATTVHCRCSR